MIKLQFAAALASGLCLALAGSGPVVAFAASGAETGTSGGRAQACAFAINAAGKHGTVVGGCDCEKHNTSFGEEYTCVAAWTGPVDGAVATLTIQDAQWGSGSTFANVRDAVSARCAGQSSCVFPATNAVLGQDPTPMKVKTLMVSYSCPGKARGIYVNEGASASLNCAGPY